MYLFHQHFSSWMPTKKKQGFNRLYKLRCSFYLVGNLSHMGDFWQIMLTSEYSPVFLHGERDSQYSILTNTPWVANSIWSNQSHKHPIPESCKILWALSYFIFFYFCRIIPVEEIAEVEMHCAKQRPSAYRKSVKSFVLVLLNCLFMKLNLWFFQRQMFHSAGWNALAFK